MRASGGFLDRVWRVELRNTRVSASYPAKRVHRPGICQPSADLVSENFQERMRAQVFVVVDIGFYQNALGVPYRCGVLFMKCQLYVRFTELNLFIATSSPGVEKTRPDFWRKYPLPCCELYLIQKSFVPIRKETVLGE